MKYRKLGNTDLLVSEVGFGTIPILKGNVKVLPNYYNCDDYEAISIMEYAYNLGCNIFDTAIVPEYGDAEIKLGKFANKIGREKIIISDKARFFKGHDIYEAVCTSIKNLGTYPDIYFVHQVDLDNMNEVFENGGALDALQELKKQGKIRYTGIASHYYDVLLKGANDKRVDVLQGSGNILERGMLDRIENEIAFKQKGFILNKVYAAGILPNFFDTKELINGVLSYPISTALIGIGTKQQADSAFLYEYENKKYKRPSFNSVISRLNMNFEPIYCDRCQKCTCDYGTEIHILFRQYNYYFLGKDYWALRKLDLSIKESADYCRKCINVNCIKCCPYSIDIPNVIQKIDLLVNKHIRNSII